MPQVHLDTIPIWDAYKLNTECPLCALESSCEKQFLEIALGGAMMEPDTRIRTNEMGFCAHHFSLLFHSQNKLSLALMTHTHLKDVMTGIEKETDNLLKALENEKKHGAVTRAAHSVTKSSPFHKQLFSSADYVDGRMNSCFICDRIDKTMQRYVETVCYLYKKDESFRKTFAESKGLCLKHYPMLLRGAQDYMSGKQQLDFVRSLVELERKNLERTEHDLEWFTLKFDYRNQDKPWGESKDAVERTINKLKGLTIRSE